MELFQTHKKRRTELWRKNKKHGLTEQEINEYKNIHRRIMQHIKRKFPEHYPEVVHINKFNRIKFNRL